MQRIGESRWRPLELCYWPDQGTLPAKGKEYPGLGYKRVRDKPPKAQEQQQPAEAQQRKDFSVFIANPNCKGVYNQLQRRLVRKRQRRHPMLMPVFEDPSNQAVLAKLQELGSINLRGDANTIGAHSMQLALEEDMAELSMERHGRAKQLVVFFGAATIGSGGRWGADAVLKACCKVVCRPRGSDQLLARVVLVDEHRTTRVSSAVNGQQPCEEEVDHEQPTRRADWKPPAGQVDLRLSRPAWSQQRDQPVRGLMWCPLVAPRKTPQAPSSSQAATQPAASEPGPSTPPPAKLSNCTKAEQAAEPTQPAKSKGKARARLPKPNQHHSQADQAALLAKGKEHPSVG
ncbi:hypothetical protein QJQ45_020472 [Haematococcus lacustris]|nr:hypothetical protein QJQ45_020472 [Haematococcus lacustris]